MWFLCRMKGKRSKLRIEKLTLSGFRNIAAGELNLSPGVNILYGDNAQGKTNLLEACWLFTGGKSFRGAKDSEMVAFGSEKAVLTMDFEAFERKQTATISIAKRRTLEINGIAQKSPTAITGRFHAVVFCPAHLRLISGAPEERRKFVDSAYCQLRPAYIHVLSEHARILTQRNALIRAVKNGDISRADGLVQLPVWDEQLSVAAAKVTLARVAYLKKITPIASKIYHGLSGGKEQLNVSLLSTVQNAEQADAITLRDGYLQAFAASSSHDLSAGFTTVGAHREDVYITIDGISAKDFGSQGQQRSAILALKLAEASLLKDITGEQPVALLDDVMSELDVRRQDYILNHIHDWQVLITCCDPVAIERQTGGKIIQIQNGNILV